ncbi:MAG: PEP-CTERM sorting domain-containing protein [Planctomycetota bacterium]
MKSTLAVCFTLAASLVASQSHAQYVQLADLPTINGGDGTTLISGTIVGNDAFAMLSGGGLHRIVKIADVGGANTVTTLADTASLNTTLGETPTGISGTLLASGGDLIILENSTDQIVTIDQGTGASSLLVSDTVLDGLPGVSGAATVSFGDIDPTTGNAFFYEGDTDSVYEVTGTDAVSLVLTDTELAAISGDDTPSGLAVDGAGVLYVGQNSSPENVAFFDPSDDSSGTVITEGDVLAAQGAGSDIGISSTAFTFVNGVVAFANTGTPDNFVTFDPADPTGTLDIALREVQLLAGPAGIDAAIAFSSFNGNLAWFNLSSGGGGVPGIYAIPEPASVMVLASLGLVAVGTRRRTA